MKVSVIGLGYIGLPTAAIMADHNISVYGYDTNQEVVDTINRGEIHIFEPDLEKIIKRCISNQSLRVSNKLSKSNVFIIAVPTPIKKNKSPNLSFVKKAADKIAPLLEKGNLVILESTSPVGATEKLTSWLRTRRKDLAFPDFKSKTNGDVKIAHCPERVLPGNVIREIIKNDRIIGGMSLNCSKEASKVYKKFVKGECIETDCRTAEMIKLVENSFRDVNIAFANELSLISEKVGVDVWKLIQLANQHPRVNILNPGPGVGGHCIAVDPWFIVNSAPNEAKIIKKAREINDSKPAYVLKKVKEAVKMIGKDPSRINISCFGIAFKPDIDDLRESPSFEISKKISKMGFKEQYIVEPNIKELPSSLKSKKVSLSDSKKAIKKGNILVFLVKHKSFNMPDKNLTKNKILINPVGLQ